MAQLTIDIDEDTLAALEREASKKHIPIDRAGAYCLEKLFFGMPRKLPIPYEKYIPANTVIILNEAQDQIEKPFRCTTCGNQIFTYYGTSKVLMNGQFDSSNNMVGGEEVDWFDKLGIPTKLECSGRVFVTYADGRIGKIRCRATYYKVGV